MRSCGSASPRTPGSGSWPPTAGGPASTAWRSWWERRPGRRRARLPLPAGAPRTKKWPRDPRSPPRAPERRAVRDLVIVGIVCASLPLIVYRPFFGLLVYGWLAYMRLQDMGWGLTQELPLSQRVGIARVEKGKWLRVTARAMASLCAITVLFTFSRGGFITLACVVPALIWRQRHRLAVFALVALVTAGVVWFTSAAFTAAYTERTSSISDYEEDGSARGRLNAWTTSWRVFLDYPAFGVGPNNLQIVHPRYSPDPNRFRVSHNAYLQVLAECGLPALLLFVAVIVSGLVSLGRLRRATDLPWVETYARMMQISILAYVVGSMFLNTAYSELIYQLVAISVSLELAARAAAGSDVGAIPALARAEEPWWRRPATSVRAIGGVQAGRA